MGRTNLAKDERSTSPLLTLDKLVCAQRHTLPQRSDDERVGCAQETEVLAERHVLSVQEHHGLVTACVETLDVRVARREEK